MRCICGNEGEFEKVWFEEPEYKTSGGIQVRTGRYRKACSHLVCLECGKNHCVDDSFDGPWYHGKSQRK